MCGRFTLTSTPEELALRFELDAAPPDLPPRYNIAPGQDVLSVRAEQAGRRADLLRWGLVPAWAKDPGIGARMINARAETAATRNAFRDALGARRCLVPADGFYEWADLGGFKQPYYVSPERCRVLAFAGLWERWGGGDETLETCTLLTTDASPPLRALHDRMPIVVDPSDYTAWLDPAEDGAALVERMRRAPAPVFRIHPVSPRVNRADAEGAHCIAPVPEPPRQEALF